MLTEAGHGIQIRTGVIQNSVQRSGKLAKDLGISGRTCLSGILGFHEIQAALEGLGSGGKQFLIDEGQIAGLRKHTMNAVVDRLAVFIILSQFIEQRSIKIKKIVAGFPEIEGTDLLQIVELFLQALVSTAEVQTSLTQHTKGQIRLLYQDPVIVRSQDPA